MKHRQVGQQLLLALLLVLLSSTSLAMRCGNRLIQEGDTKLEVVRKCGQPSFVEGSGVIEREEEVIAADQLQQKLLLIGRQQQRRSQPVETWHYNCGTNRFSRLLTFVGPYLQRIETGDQGYGLSGCKQPPEASQNNTDDHPTPGNAPEETSRRVLDAAIEFRQLHRDNLPENKQLNDAKSETAEAQQVFRWQDDQGLWHYSANPPN